MKDETHKAEEARYEEKQTLCYNNFSTPPPAMDGGSSCNRIKHSIRPVSIRSVKGGRKGKRRK
jgi:hypothetical protein